MATGSGSASNGAATEPKGPCPYFIAGQLGVKLKNTPTKVLTCSSKGRCDRGDHVSLNTLKRDEVTQLFSVDPIAKFHVGSEGRRLAAEAPDNKFHP